MRIFWLELNGVRYHLKEGDTSLGRGEESTLFLEDPSVSRKHAVLRRTGDVLSVTDLGSSNGTQVNGQRLQGTRQLRLGDVIQLGSSTLKLGATVPVEPSPMAPGIEIMEERAARPQAELTTAPQFSSIDVLESLITSYQVAEDPASLANMIKSSVERLISTTQGRGQALGDDAKARLISIAEIVASWFADGSFDAWASSITQQLKKK